MLFFALGTAEHITLIACNKSLLAMLAKFQGLVLISQHETEHHLDSRQQGMEIPDNGGLIEQSDMVSGSHAIECGHAQFQRLFCIILQTAVILIIENMLIDLTQQTTRCGDSPGQS